MALTLPEILALSPRAEADAWAVIEDDLLLDLDLGIGFDITVTDPVHVWAAGRLESRGVVVVSRPPSMAVRPSVRVARVPSNRFVRKAA